MYSTHPVYLIAAVDETNGIGKKGALPWRLPSEMKFFARVTKDACEGSQNMVIMGSRTWESLPPKYRPLPERQNVVLSRRPEFAPEGAHVAPTLDAAFALSEQEGLKLSAPIDKIFVIGGAQVYAEALPHLSTDGIYLTRVHGTFDCDIFLPPIPSTFSQTESLGRGEDDGVVFEHLLLTRPH